MWRFQTCSFISISELLQQHFLSCVWICCSAFLLMSLRISCWSESLPHRLASWKAGKSFDRSLAGFSPFVTMLTEKGLMKWLSSLHPRVLLFMIYKSFGHLLANSQQAVKCFLLKNVPCQRQCGGKRFRRLFLRNLFHLHRDTCDFTSTGLVSWDCIPWK